MDVRPSDRVRVAGGVSALYGSGFHAGTDASKPAVSWVDLNQNGQIERTALATSKDLIHWEKYPGNPVAQPDPRVAS